MKKFVADEYKQQREYESFTSSFVNRHFAWENPQIEQKWWYPNPKVPA